MSILLDKEIIGQLIPLMTDPEHEPLLKRLERIQFYGGTQAIFADADWNIDQVILLGQLADRINHRALKMKCSALRGILSDPACSKVGSLRNVEPGIRAWLNQDYLDGWLYATDGDGHPVPWLVSDVKHYVPRDKSDGKPYVTVSLMASRGVLDAQQRSKNSGESIIFFAHETVSLSLPALFSKHGFHHETPALKAQYEASMVRFAELQGRHGEQFLVMKGGAMDLTSLKYRSRELTASGPARVINDDDLVTRAMQDQVSLSFWRFHDSDESRFRQLPQHPYLYCFDLARHANVWVHPAYMEPYPYDASLSEKLILPQVHRDLLDVLVADLDVLNTDIIAGKSAGTTILCTGGPGLGKTLSAEAYSEIVAKPLYRVHSGQLGINATEIERQLREVLLRAQRWGAILLIDEADVYIRQRGDDVLHNAIVAAFLRTLEYFSGLLFMTSNRVNDIDDAIMSRCIAHIKYETPDADSARRIWSVMSVQLGAELPASLIEDLVLLFPEASGRDIKNLLALVMRYVAAREEPYSVDVFRKIAVFRGLI